MRRVLSLLDGPSETDVEELVERAKRHSVSLRPFNLEVVDFCVNLSRFLRNSHQYRRNPALAALAWSIRRSQIDVLKNQWEFNAEISQVVPIPRGVIFHVPPTNVDTMFIYSWLMSALVGNGNIVRLSPKTLSRNEVLFAEIAEVLKSYPSIYNSTVFVSYDRDVEISTYLSQMDGRVIWGGDETISAFKKIESLPGSMSLEFRDRFSFTALRSDKVLELNDQRLRDLVHDFSNDVFWFDQLGCSSPRLVVWIGDESRSNQAMNRFVACLKSKVEAMNLLVQPSDVISKLVHAGVRASAGQVQSVDWSQNEVTTVVLNNDAEFPRDNPGGGLLYSVILQKLDDIVEKLDRRDQTMTYFGFERKELVAFTELAGSRMVDRVVPVGNALKFGNYWDGYDIMRSLTRLVVVE